MINKVRKVTHHSTHVVFRGRHYVVDYDEYNVVLRIKHRKPKTSPMIGYYDNVVWSAAHHKLGVRPDTRPKLIIALAEEKNNALHSVQQVQPVEAPSPQVP